MPASRSSSTRSRCRRRSSRGLTKARVDAYQGSMYSFFETQFGVRMLKAQEKLRAVPADAASARILGRAARAIRCSPSIASRSPMATGPSNGGAASARRSVITTSTRSADRSANARRVRGRFASALRRLCTASRYNSLLLCTNAVGPFSRRTPRKGPFHASRGFPPCAVSGSKREATPGLSRPAADPVAVAGNRLDPAPRVGRAAGSCRDSAAAVRASRGASRRPTRTRR